VDGAIVAKTKGSGQLRVAIYALPQHREAGEPERYPVLCSRHDRRMSYYIIVRGPLGSGKTTVSRRVAKILRARYISIDRILDEQDLWYSGRLSEFLRVNALAARQARRELTRGTPVVFDGNFYWKTQLADLTGRLKFPHRVFTLKVPLPVCIERDSHRNPPHGRKAAEQVFSRSTRFEAGIGIDARPPVDHVVAMMIERLRTARFAPGV
jgi:cytidylate kinase